MEIEKVKRILSLLAEGIDPFTGEVYPETSPYHNPETIRALYQVLRILEGNQQISTKVKSSKIVKSENSSLQIDNFLFEKLRQLRFSMAIKIGVPAYFIMNNRTLMEISSIKPKNVDELKNIKGLGDQKIKLYGPAFLAVIAGQSPDKVMEVFSAMKLDLRTDPKTTKDLLIDNQE